MLSSGNNSSFHGSRYGFDRQFDCHGRIEIVNVFRIHDLDVIYDLAKRFKSTFEQRHCLTISCNAVARILNQ